MTAYCPLGRPIPAEKKPGFLYDAKLIEIGKNYGKTPAQVVFRYLVSDIKIQKSEKILFLKFRISFIKIGWHWNRSYPKIRHTKTNRRKHQHFRFQVDWRWNQIHWYVQYRRACDPLSRSTQSQTISIWNWILKETKLKSWSPVIACSLCKYSENLIIC